MQALHGRRVRKERIKKCINADRETATLEMSDYIDDFYNSAFTRVTAISAVSVRSSLRRRIAGID
jgi:hypothetical protein